MKHLAEEDITYDTTLAIILTPQLLKNNLQRKGECSQTGELHKTTSRL